MDESMNELSGTQSFQGSLLWPSQPTVRTSVELVLGFVSPNEPGGHFLPGAPRLELHRISPRGWLAEGPWPPGGTTASGMDSRNARRSLSCRQRLRSATPGTCGGPKLTCYGLYSGALVLRASSTQLAPHPHSNQTYVCEAPTRRLH